MFRPGINQMSKHRVKSVAANKLSEKLHKNWKKNPSPGTQGYKSEKGLYLTIEG